MRARNIKPGFFKNEDLAEVEPLGRILFAGLWCMADREGRLEDRPKRIKAEILPYDNVSADKLLKSLHDAKFILRYANSTGKFIQILNFSRHQTPHMKEQASIIPAPDLHQTSIIQEQDLHGSCLSDSLNLIPDSSTDSSICASSPSASPKINKIIDPVFYNGTYFELTKSQFETLRKKANGMTDAAFGDFLKSLDLYVPNQPTKYHRKADGKLKNPATILSRWLDNLTLKNTNLSPENNSNCINHPNKSGAITINNRWYCRACADLIDKQERELVIGKTIN